MNRKSIIRIVSWYLVSVLFALNVQAQVLPPMQPEQDACGALMLCNNEFFTPFSYTGPGKNAFEVDNNGGFNQRLENNSVWLKVKIAGAGNIIFTITPVNPLEDYDFTVVNVTGSECPYNTSSLADAIIRFNGNCNGNCSETPNYPMGKIGLDYNSNDLTTEVGINGKPFLKFIEAKTGDEYLILVDNFTGSPAGFSINFSGSTATFEQPENGIESVTPICAAGDDYFTRMQVKLKAPVLCSSVATDGSDFTLGQMNPGFIKASGINCSAGSDAYTHELILTLNGQLELGKAYTLSTKTGTDSNSLLDLCKNSNGFSAGKDFVVKLPYQINISRDTAVCTGGSVQLNGVLEGEGNVRVRWQPSTYLNSNTVANPIVTPLEDINYVVTLAPSGLPTVCQTKETVKIKVLKGFNINTADTTLCKPEPVSVSLAGDPEFEYKWSPVLYLDGTTGMNNTATPAKDVSYTITASYPGCKDSLQIINFFVKQWPTLMNNDTLICEGQPVSMKITGGSGYSYNWAPAIYLNNPLSLMPIAKPTQSTSYQFISSHTGCKDSVQTVTINTESFPKIEIDDVKLCQGDEIRLMPKVSPDTYNRYQYKWNPSGLFSKDNIQTPVFRPSADTTITLEVSTEAGCHTAINTHAQVFPLPKPNAGTDIQSQGVTPVQLNGTVDDITDTYSWLPSPNLSNHTILNPVVSGDGIFRFILMAETKNGCKSSDTVIVNINKPLQIPNAFSPNGDGINDTWVITGLGIYPMAEITIVNRWGQTVYESRGIYKPWSGNYNNKPQATGTYYYIIKPDKNKNDILSGSVTLIR